MSDKDDLNFNEVDEQGNELFDENSKKEENDDDKDGYEEYCYLCHRPQSIAGRLIHMPNDICICQDCMQKTFDGLPVKIMVKRPLGGLGFKDDVLHRGILIPLLIEQLPGCGYDSSPGISGILSRHVSQPPHVLCFYYNRFSPSNQADVLNCTARSA